MKRLCEHKGCHTTLPEKGQFLLCSFHRRGNYRGKTCAAPGCDKAITAKNTSGLCPDHKMAAYRAAHPQRVCQGCTTLLHHQNKSGMCGRCLSINGTRKRRRCLCGTRISDHNKSGQCLTCLHPSVSVTTGKPHPPYTLPELVATAAWLTRTPVDQINGVERPRWLTRIRFAICHLAEPHYSYAHIGRRIGNRDHSTIVHGCTRAADLVQRDKLFASFVESIRRETLARQMRLAA